MEVEPRKYYLSLNIASSYRLDSLSRIYKYYLKFKIMN